MTGEGSEGRVPSMGSAETVDLVVVVVAKTRMKGQICVGSAIYRGVDGYQAGAPLRLLPPKRSGWAEKDFLFQVGDKIRVRGACRQPVEPPHNEDFDCGPPEIDTPIDEQRKKFFRPWIEQNCNVWTGGVENTFGGLLRLDSHPQRPQERKPRFLSRKAELPASSVGFWRLPYDLEHRVLTREPGLPKHYYEGPADSRLRLKYVGLQSDLPSSLREGSLLRLSLSRWFAPRNEDRPRCWLQLSGWYE